MRDQIPKKNSPPYKSNQKAMSTKSAGWSGRLNPGNRESAWHGHNEAVLTKLFESCRCLHHYSQYEMMLQKDVAQTQLSHALDNNVQMEAGCQGIEMDKEDPAEDEPDHYNSEDIQGKGLESGQDEQEYKQNNDLESEVNFKLPEGELFTTQAQVGVQVDADIGEILEQDADRHSLKSINSDHTKKIDRIPDRVMLHITDRNLQLPEDQMHQYANAYKRHGGRLVTHCCVPFIEEDKKAPNRKLTEEMLPDGIQRYLQMADTELLEYLSIHFHKHRKETHVITRATSGPFWKWTAVDREEVPDYNLKTRKVVNKEEDEVKARDWFLKCGDLPVYETGTKLSDTALTSMREAVYDVIRECRTKYT
ncbi:hypothetical protein E1B28_000166 [Marasmius oreades]|uniref:Uncharacterized protein n=1 Tax=Marasmius oreades TaxID=181124 RepID=A0A9P7V0S5_9AGAR|nr:uncharacterized protein E1B28_000166 [Marasmius oreades]KAG7098198.1 hypothetical protein E1B28_000166 [Marasmius oreades]